MPQDRAKAIEESPTLFERWYKLNHQDTKADLAYVRD